MDPSRAFVIYFLIYMVGLFESILGMTTIQYNITEKRTTPFLVGNIVDDTPLKDKYAPSVIDTLRFKILPTSKNKEYFDLNSVSGDVKITKNIDRDLLCPSQEQCQLSLDVGVEPINFSDLFKVLVNVGDLNDQKPTFSQAVVTKSISEGSPIGSEFSLPLATDNDSPQYSIVNYTINNTDIFKLESRTNSQGRIVGLSLKLLQRLDREKQKEYYVAITALDGGTPGQTGQCIVHVTVTDTNDNAPSFKNNTYVISVHEILKKDTFLLKVSAVDLDEDQRGVIKYRIDDQSTAVYGSPFRINEHTGNIYVNDKLDYESRQKYEIGLIAEDDTPEKLVGHATLVVNIIDDNDNAPQILTGSEDDSNSWSVEEEVPESQFVTYVSVSDLDSSVNGQFTCSVNNELFQLVGTTSDGLFRLMTTGRVDREQQETLKVSVRCSDHGEPPLTSQKEISVSVKDVNDHAPAFSSSHYVVDVQENNRVGDQLAQVTASDNDAGHNSKLEYYVDPKFNSFINVDQSEGIIYAAKAMDREVLDTVEFAIYAIDKGSPPRTAQSIVTINVLDKNDEKPLFGQETYSFEIHENLPVNSTIGFVSAKDRDLFPFNQFTYEIVQPGDLLKLFTIDPIRGELNAKQSLDYEEADHYELIVAAADRDKPALRSSVLVKVLVQDLNDNAPEIIFPNELNHTVYVPLNAPPGHMVAKASAVDIDSGTNSQLQFSMKPLVDNDSSSHFFTIDPTTGIIVSTSELLEETNDTFEITVTDCGKPPLSSTSVLQIKIIKSLTADSIHQDTEATNRTIIVALTVVFIFLVVLLTFCIYLVLRRRKAASRAATATKLPPEERQDMGVCANIPADQHPVGIFPVVKEVAEDGDSSEGRRSDNADSGISGDLCDHSSTDRLDQLSDPRLLFAMDMGNLPVHTAKPAICKSSSVPATRLRCGSFQGFRPGGAPNGHAPVTNHKPSQRYFFSTKSGRTPVLNGSDNSIYYRNSFHDFNSRHLRDSNRSGTSPRKQVRFQADYDESRGNPSDLSWDKYQESVMV